MARPPKGKPLTMRTVRLDDDVWAECQRLGKEHGTINEGLRARLIGMPTAVNTPETPEQIFQQAKDMVKAHVAKQVAQPSQTWKRGPRPKGDKSR
jgi:hypothetical protein